MLVVNAFNLIAFIIDILYFEHANCFQQAVWSQQTLCQQCSNYNCDEPTSRHMQDRRCLDLLTRSLTEKNPEQVYALLLGGMVDTFLVHWE